MKILMIAFGNPDNVLSLCRNISDESDITLVLVVSGNKFQQGILDLDLENVPEGLHKDKKYVFSVLGNELSKYIGERFKIWILKTRSRKVLYKKTGITNLLIISDACQVLNHHKYDVVHFNGTSGFMLYFLLFLKINKRFWTLHDYKSHSGEENPSGELFNKIISNFKFRYIQHYEYLRSEFINYYKKDPEIVHCVYSGPFDVYNEYDNDEKIVEGKYVLFFGRISRYKGLDVLVEVFENKIRDKSIKLVIAGSGGIDLNIKNINQIIFINKYLSPYKLVSLIKNSEFIIAPYNESTHSGVIMTAYNFRKPIIATDLNGINEVVIDNSTGFLFKKGDNEDLKHKIEFLYNNTNILSQLSQNIDKLVSEGMLSWKNISSEMHQLYSKTY